MKKLQLKTIAALPFILVAFAELPAIAKHTAIESVSKSNAESSVEIIATDQDIAQIVKEEIAKHGKNANLNHINVSKITSLERLFFSSPFNGDISEWDVSNVKNMNATFLRSAFNGDISNWDVSNVTTMRSCFNQSQFNGDLSKWNTAKVQNMSRMFMSSPFNKDISSWDVRKVEDMSQMFEGSKFNMNLSQWQVGAKTDISKICSNRAFQSTLSTWEKRRKSPADDHDSQEKEESTGSPIMTGMVYDLARASDGTILFNLSRENHRLAETTCYNAIWEFYDEDWNPKNLKKYRVSDEPVYISHFYLPSLPAQQLSSTLAKKTAIRAPFLMLFRAKVRAPQSGKFRFVGAGDDVLAVRLNKKVVLEAGFFLPSLFDPKLAKRSSTKRFFELKGNDKEYISFLKTRKIPNRKTWSLVEYPGCSAFNSSLGGLTCGEVFTVKKGQVITLEILYAEVSGGASQFLLLIDDLSKKAKPDEQKIYDLFRTSAGSPDESSLKKVFTSIVQDEFPPYDKDSPIWVVTNSL